MKLKEFESILQGVETFANPKYELEQYPTSPHIASRILFTADRSYDDIEDKLVLDLGCGTGMLAVGANILGSGYTVGIDIDSEALALANKNIEEFEVDVDLIQADILKICDGSNLFKSLHSFDTVIMNPPFGTRKKGADTCFVEAGLAMSRSAVYSLHKSSTRNHFEKKAKEWGVEFQVVAQLRFDIPKMYKFHKKESADVQVDLLRFSWPEGKFTIAEQDKKASTCVCEHENDKTQAIIPELDTSTPVNSTVNVNK